MAEVPLTGLRSWEADDTLAYLTELCLKLAPRQGSGSGSLGRAGPRLSPLRVVCYDPDAPDLLAIAELQDEAGRQLTLDRLALDLERVMILGEAEGSRTEWLKQLAARTASNSLSSLRDGVRLPGEVCLPILLQFADVAAAMSDRREIDKILIEIGGDDAPLTANARHFGAALLVAAGGSFSVRVRHLLWPSLWPVVAGPDEAAALIILDDWSEISPEQQKAVEPFLSAFLEQTGARVFLGSQFFSPHANPSFLSTFKTGRQQILCLWPYELRVPSGLLGISVRRFYDIVELRRATAPPEAGAPRRFLTRRRTIIGSITVVALSSVIALVWIRSTPQLRITEPNGRTDVCQTNDVEVRAPDGAGAVWVVIHPSNHRAYFVEPKPRFEDGVWKTSAFFGDPGTGGTGFEFQIRAVADPSSPLKEADQLPGWPMARYVSPIVRVKRGPC